MPVRSNNNFGNNNNNQQMRQPQQPYGRARVNHINAQEAQEAQGVVCRMDLPGPTSSVGIRTDYSVGPWDYPACTTRHLMASSTRTTEEKYSVKKLYMSRTVWKTPRRTRLVLSPYSDL
jgi:hypothetical protein